jgi:hypothetical protein
MTGRSIRRNLRAALVCAMGLGLCSLAPPACGDEAPSPTRWYGWQTLAVDAVSLGTSTLGFALPSGVLFSSSGQALVGVGLLGYAAGPPVVHGMHGHGGTAGIDAAIRITAPFVLGRVSRRLRRSDRVRCRRSCARTRGRASGGAPRSLAATEVLDIPDARARPARDGSGPRWHVLMLLGQDAEGAKVRNSRRPSARPTRGLMRHRGVRRSPHAGCPPQKLRNDYGGGEGPADGKAYRWWRPPSTGIAVSSRDVPARAGASQHATVGAWMRRLRCGRPR